MPGPAHRAWYELKVVPMNHDYYEFKQIHCECVSGLY